MATPHQPAAPPSLHTPPSAGEVTSTAKMLARFLFPTPMRPGQKHILIFTALIRAVTPTPLAPPTSFSRSCLSHWELLSVKLHLNEDLPSCFSCRTQ